MTKEEEREYIIQCAKIELAYFKMLLDYWLHYYKEDTFNKIVKFYVYRGCEIDSRYEEENYKEVYFLGTICGFTLTEKNGKIAIDYAWAFTGYSDEID